MITDMKDAVAAKGEEDKGFTIDTHGILKIANAAHRGMVQKNNEKDTVNAGSRRNGFLSWRPSLNQGKFARADTQKWCQNPDGPVKFPGGSHRMREDWHKERYDWLDADGKPVIEDLKGAPRHGATNEWKEIPPNYIIKEKEEKEEKEKKG